MSNGWNVHTFTIKALTVTQDARTGGVVRTYSTDARGSLPKTIKGRAVRLTNTQKLDHGVRGEYTGWKLLTLSNPHIGLDDRVEFHYQNDECVTVKVTMASNSRIGATPQSRFYETAGEEDSTEE